jgi:Family of unknown function (DUF5906)
MADDNKTAMDKLRAQMESESSEANDMMTNDAGASTSADTAADKDKKDDKKDILGVTKTPPRNMTGAQHAVREMNKKYALVNMGKDSLIAVNRGDSYDFWSIKNFLLNTGNVTVPVTTSRGTKDTPIGEVWLRSPDRRDYARADFDPSGSVPDDVFNFWRGFGVETIPGISFLQAARGCHKLLRHIRDNLCKGSHEEYHYFMRWCADLVQFPHIKSGVAVSISGRKGTGKTKVVEIISQLFGHHSTTVSHSRHLVGNFNAHLRQALLIVAEEALWGGDKSADGPLKHMITSTNQVIEQKGVDAVTIKNLARIMFVGNKTWMFPADEDERRLFALTCGDEQMRNEEYFSAIDLQIYGHVKGFQQNPMWRECGGIRSFMTFLTMIDLTHFKIRQIPETEGLRDQRQSTLEPHARYFQELIEGRTIGYESASEIDYLSQKAEWKYGETQTVKKTDIFDRGFIEWCRRNNVRHPIAQNAFWRWVKKVFGWSECKIGPAGKQIRAMKVDGVEVAAKMFSDAMKVDQIVIDDESY